MENKEAAFREWIKEKMKDKVFKYLCYASHSFGKQRRAMHDLMCYTKKEFPDIYQKMPFLRYLICGWADDITQMMDRCFDDFTPKFGTGISVGTLEKIIQEEL